MLGADVLVPTLSGPRLVGDLAGEGPVYVFTWDGERVTVGRIVVETTPTLTVPYRLELDDESRIIACRESMVLLRNGAPRFLEQVSEGTSLLPLYMRLDKSSYPVYQEPGEWHKGAISPSDKNRWRRVSRMVAEWKLERRCAPGDVVSYLSRNRTNCHPDNLKIIQKKRKTAEKKVEFAEPLFEAQRFIDRHNHQVACVYLDISRNLLSIRGLGTSNVSVGGIFISVDSE